MQGIENKVIIITGAASKAGTGHWRKCSISEIRCVRL